MSSPGASVRPSRAPSRTRSPRSNPETSCPPTPVLIPDPTVMTDGLSRPEYTAVVTPSRRASQSAKRIEPLKSPPKPAYGKSWQHVTAMGGPVSFGPEAVPYR